MEKGYFSFVDTNQDHGNDVTEFCNVTENSNGLENLPSLVAQLVERRQILENERSSPRRDLNARPKVFAPTLELERRITKPSLCRLSY